MTLLALILKYFIIVEAGGVIILQDPSISSPRFLSIRLPECPYVATVLVSVTSASDPSDQYKPVTAQRCR